MTSPSAAAAPSGASVPRVELPNWNVLPNPVAESCLAPSSVRRATGKAFLALGTLSAGSSVFCATYLKATAGALLIATFGLAGLATISLVGALFFFMLLDRPLRK